MKYSVLTILLILFIPSFLSAQKRVVTSTSEPKYEIEDGLVKVTNFYSTGEIREYGFYDAERKLTGEWIQFDKTGKRIIVANYFKGNKVGKWLVWKGDKLLQLDYEQSKIANVSEWKDTSTLADN